MNLGLLMLIMMAMIFAIAVVGSMGKLIKWFFFPQHCRVLQKIFWMFVVIFAIAAYFG